LERDTVLSADDVHFGFPKPQRASPSHCLLPLMSRPAYASGNCLVLKRNGFISERGTINVLQPKNNTTEDDQN
jgi:hypothetical protein